MERATPLDSATIVVTRSRMKNDLELAKYKETERSTRCRQMGVQNVGALCVLPSIRTSNSRLSMEIARLYNMYGYRLDSLKT